MGVTNSRGSWVYKVVGRGYTKSLVVGTMSWVAARPTKRGRV